MAAQSLRRALVNPGCLRLEIADKHCVAVGGWKQPLEVLPTLQSWPPCKKEERKKQRVGERERKSTKAGPAELLVGILLQLKPCRLTL